MTTTLIILLAAIAIAILVVKNKSKAKQVSKIEDVVLPEIDMTPVLIEKPIESKQTAQSSDSIKKKRKYHKKKHPKKMDADKK